MSPGRPSTRFGEQAREQLRRHAGLAVGDVDVELRSWVDGVARSVVVASSDLRRGRVTSAGSGAPASAESRSGPADAGRSPAAAHHAMPLLVDAVDHETLGDVTSSLEEAVAQGRPTIVWARASRLGDIRPLLGAGGAIEVLEQVSIEGVALVAPGTASVAAEVDTSDALREGDRVAVLGVNLAGQALDVATDATHVEAGSEREHLATALVDLRRANATLGKAQRGKSQAAQAMFVRSTERRIARELEERMSADEQERSSWIASMEAEIGELKQRIVEMESRRAWRWVVRLDGWRQRLGRSRRA